MSSNKETTITVNFGQKITTELTKPISEFETRQVDWLWWPVLPLGKISIIEGEPDVGKSLITLDIATRVSRGKSFPHVTIDGSYDTRSETLSKTAPRDAIVIGVEDDIEDTVKPRLESLGADIRRIHTLKVRKDNSGMPVPFVIPGDLSRLSKAIRATSSVLVIIDPITAFLSEKIRPGDDSSHRRALSALAEMCSELKTSCLLVRHHNKAVGMSAKNRGGGSVAIGALSRSVIVVSEQESGNKENGEYAMARVKCNIGPKWDSLGYNIEPSSMDATLPVIEWTNSVEVTADELVNADTGDANVPLIKEAVKCLKETLANGPLPMKECVETVSSTLGCSEKTIKKARARAGILSRQVRSGDSRVDYWEWLLPQHTVRILRTVPTSLAQQTRDPRGIVGDSRGS